MRAFRLYALACCIKWREDGTRRCEWDKIGLQQRSLRQTIESAEATPIYTEIAILYNRLKER